MKLTVNPMPLLFRAATASAAALAILTATVPAGAQEQDPRRFQHQRHPQAQQQRPQAQQQRPDEGQRRRGNGAGIAAGVIGGLAAGALLGGALGGRGGGPVEPGYVEDGGPGPGYGGCPPVREPVYDGAGRFAGYRAVPSC